MHARLGADYRSAGPVDSKPIVKTQTIGYALTAILLMKRNLAATLAIAMILPTATAIGALFVVPRFAEVFAGFGAELPLETRLLLATYRWWLALPVLVVVIGMSWPKPIDRATAAVVSGLILAIAMVAFVMWACYVPIFKLAA